MQKRLLLFGLLSCLSLFSFGQNWTIIPTEHKLNFLADGQDIIQNTIWVDSTTTDGAVIVHHLNRVVICDNPPTDCLRNQAGLLGKEITVENGQYHFGIDGNLTILPNASVGATWLYNSTDNITAEVVAIEEMNVLGTIDSVKTIALSNLETILLSKQWGLLSYPTTATHYTTVGIDNLDLGETVPDFFDIYDFEVGDVFYYRENDSASQGNGDQGNETLSKREILSKTVLPERLEYEVHILAQTESWFTLPPTTIYYDEVRTIAFNYSSDYSTNFYHQDVLTYGENGPDEPFWALNNVSKDEQGRYTKSIGLQDDWDSFFGGGFIINTTTDTLEQSSGPDEFQMIYKEGLGRTRYIYWSFEFFFSRELIGYIKDGVEVGEIIPDEDLIVSVDELTASNAFTLYPNPAQDYIRLNFLTTNQRQGQWEIRDLAGQLVLAGSYNGEDLSLATLAAGVYVFSFIEDGGVYTQKVVKY